MFLLFITVLGTILPCVSSSFDQEDRISPYYVRFLSPFADPRQIYVLYLAKFGMRFLEPERVNIMYPPLDDEYLCQYPPSLENSTFADVAMSGVFSNFVPIALLVRRGECFAEQKARAIQQMRDNLSVNVKYLIIYEDNPDNADAAVTFVHKDSTIGGGPPQDLESIGISYLPYYAALDLKERIQQYQDNGGGTNRDPHLLNSTENRNWSLLFRISGPPSESNGGWGNGFGNGVGNRGFSNGDGNGNDTYGFSEPSFYWFRIVMFGLLIVAPCIRAGYLWYSGGGRLHWRRNERGWIVGIQYIPPIPWWLGGGRIQNTNQNAVRDTITEEQFQSLPTILYEPPPMTAEEEEEAVNEKRQQQLSTDEESQHDDDLVDKATDEILVSRIEDEETAEQADKVTDEMLVNRMEDEESADKLKENPTKHRIPDDDIDGIVASALGSTDEEDDNDDLVDLEKQMATTGQEKSYKLEDDNDSTSKTFSKSSSEESQDDDGKIEKDSDPMKTSCTCCSICIDDFEAGESLILLPRCKHAFHKDCIHPWLLERQGCCPLCKTEVFESATEGQEEAAAAAAAATTTEPSPEEPRAQGAGDPPAEAAP